MTDIQQLRLKGALLITPKVFPDTRGFFLESYRKTHYVKAGIHEEFVQDNHSFSAKGCIRGMHFQATPGQAKLIRVAKGEIFDVFVDIRKESPTFGQWEGVTLNDKQHQQLYIPVGFAHGFCVLSEDAHVLYKVSHPYDPEQEKGFRFDDPTIHIAWPTDAPTVSERDKNSPYFHEVFSR